MKGRGESMEGITRGNALRGDLTLSCDTVIVGSGASGAVVARELSQAGEEVVVLEEGAWVPPSVYEKMRVSQNLRALWREGGTTAVIGLGNSPVINVTMGSCVGGSSVLTGGVCFRPPGRVLRRWSQGMGLRALEASQMEPYFEEVERVSQVSTVPQSMRSSSTRLFEAGLKEAFGESMEPTRRNMVGCDGCGRCNFGCPHGAKLSVDKTFLPQALETGAQLYSQALVERVRYRGDRATGVAGRLLNGAGGRPGDRFEVHARKRVVLAAGAPHTALLLMRDGIGRRSRQVGRNMTLHPSFRMTARFDRSIQGWKGALQSAYTQAFDRDGFMIISVFVPPFAVLSAVAGFGPEYMNRARKFDQMAMIGGLIHDEGGGRVWPVPFGREPLMTYKMSRRDRAIIPKIVNTLGESFFAAGAEEIYLPILGHAPVDVDAFRRIDFESIPARRYECSSQHPLGTCRMGVDPSRSVVDDRGQVWDMRGLYVVDGGVIPTSLGVNPQITVMTMALRLGRMMVD